MDHVLKPENDGMCVGCFERTGCLITMLSLDDFDAKIRPQGIEQGSFQVTKTMALPEEEIDEQVTEAGADIVEELATLLEEKVNTQEDDENEKNMFNHEEK